MKTNVHKITFTALMAALLCILSPISIPLPSPMPAITLAFVAVYLSAYITGPFVSCTAIFIYILLGCVGLPVFSKAQAGLSVLVGPTGGYILGYIPMVVVAGLAIKSFPKSRPFQLGGMILATAVLYVFGTLLFCFQTQSTLERALMVCVVPFIPFDLGKMVLATGLGPVLRDRLLKAGIHPES